MNINTSYDTVNTEFTPMRLSRSIWAVHHNNNALAILQGKKIEVKEECPHPEIRNNKCLACGKEL